MFNSSCVITVCRSRCRRSSPVPQLSGLIVGGALNRIMLCYVMLCSIHPVSLLSVAHGADARNSDTRHLRPGDWGQQEHRRAKWTCSACRRRTRRRHRDVVRTQLRLRHQSSTWLGTPTVHLGCWLGNRTLHVRSQISSWWPLGHLRAKVRAYSYDIRWVAHWKTSEDGIYKLSSS